MKEQNALNTTITREASERSEVKYHTNYFKKNHFMVVLLF